MDQWEWEDVPQAIRDEVKAEFGVNIDRALRKEPGRRSGDEQTAITRYMAELYRDEMPVNDKLIGNGNYPINDDGVPYDEYEDISVSLQDEQIPKTDGYENRREQNTRGNVTSEDGRWGTVAEWMKKTQPEEWWPIEAEATLECMKRGWPINSMEIQGIARELNEKRRAKG